MSPYTANEPGKPPQQPIKFRQLIQPDCTVAMAEKSGDTQVIRYTLRRHLTGEAARFPRRDHAVASAMQQKYRCFCIHEIQVDPVTRPVITKCTDDFLKKPLALSAITQQLPQPFLLCISLIQQRPQIPALVFLGVVRIQRSRCQ